MTPTDGPSTDGLDHTPKQGEYRLYFETDDAAGYYYSDNEYTLNAMARHLIDEHAAHVEHEAWDDYTNGYNARAAE